MHKYFLVKESLKLPFDESCSLAFPAYKPIALHKKCMITIIEIKKCM